MYVKNGKSSEVYVRARSANARFALLAPPSPAGIAAAAVITAALAIVGAIATAGVKREDYAKSITCSDQIVLINQSVRNMFDVMA
jgi:hypothetical protein